MPPVRPAAMDLASRGAMLAAGEDAGRAWLRLAHRRRSDQLVLA